MVDLLAQVFGRVPVLRINCVGTRPLASFHSVCSQIERKSEGDKRRTILAIFQLRDYDFPEDCRGLSSFEIHDRLSKFSR